MTGGGVDTHDAIDITPTKDGGILKSITTPGIGTDLPPQGAKVKVHYTGTLTDGTKFDSSRDRDQPFEFDLGKGSVIKAWDIGVATMAKGERAILTCAPEYAYGKAGSPPTIPPNSILKFDVEVLEWKGEDLSPKKDGGIERIQVEAGEGHTTPNDGAIVEVKLIGTYDGKEFDNRDVTFTIGEGSVENIISGVEKALEKFKVNETSRLIIKPQYAFGVEGSKEFQIPANATVEYLVKLKKFERAKESWALDSNEKKEQANLFKTKGTTFYKASNYQLAIKSYKKAIDFIESEKDEESTAIKLPLHLNLAMCHLLVRDFHEARAAATAALQIDDHNEKALFRRGQALLDLGEPELASKDFAKCLELYPENAAARSKQLTCTKMLQAQLIQEKKIYANMFDKFAKNDTQREEIEKKREPNVMSSVGEWGKEDREREPSEFEKENPNILLLNGSGEFKDM